MQHKIQHNMQTGMHNTNSSMEANCSPAHKPPLRTLLAQFPTKKTHVHASITPTNLLHHCHHDFHHISCGGTTSVCVFRKFPIAFLSMIPSTFKTGRSFASLLTLSIIRITLADSSPFFWYAMFASGGGQLRTRSHHVASQKQEDGSAQW